MSKQLSNFSRWLKEENYSCGFINSIANVFYFSNFYCDPHERLLGVMIFPEDTPLVVCPEMERERVRDAGWEHEIIGYTDIQNPWELMREHAERAVGAKPVIAVEKDFLPMNRAEALMGIFPGATLVAADAKIAALRNIKNEVEIESMRKAARLADKAIETAAGLLTEGVTELEVTAEVEHQMRKLGAPMAFSTIMLFGPRSAYAHGVPGDAKLKPGDQILIDLGVVYNGYCSDITRTFAYKYAKPEFQKMYDVTLEAQLAAVEACKPGNKIGAVDQASREIIVRAGYGDYCGLRVGHGIGIEVHEYPSMTSDNEALLQPGMTFTVEPGLNILGTGGVRIEDDVLITETGYELLNKFPKELKILG
ncbi:MAG: aminopeptidase P family protein [Firmicutes bacterium]|nr:aminopeptidase P family protein [Bacillota bacterium]